MLLIKLLPIKFLICIIFVINFNCYINCNEFPFEKKIWTYWHEENLQSAPMIVRLSSEHIKKIAEAAGFEYFRLSKTTVKQYITNFDEKITKVRQKSKQKAPAHEADLIRFNLIYENGGIWMDITTFLPEGIDWLLNIKSEKYRNIITNRFSEQPDALLAYFQGYQNTQQYRISNPNNKDKMILYNEMPGYEIWFFAAKKNSKLINEIRQTYTYFTQLQFKEMVDIFIKEDIYMNNVDFSSYLSANMATCYILQRKQLQLDQQMTKKFSKRKTVYQYYNLWSLSGILGPLFWTKNMGWALHHMIELSKQQYEKLGYMVNFFVKNISLFRRTLQRNMRRAKQLIYDRKLTFQQFLQSNPKQNECKQTVFLAKDSLLFDLFKNSKQLLSGEIKSITKQQKQQWHTYCKRYQKSSFFDWIKQQHSFTGLNPRDFVAYRAHEIVNFDKRQTWSLRQKVENYFYERKGDFLLLLKSIIHFGVANLVQFSVIMIFFWIMKKIKSVFNHHYLPEQISQTQNSTNSAQWFSALLHLLFIILTGVLSFHKYFMIDYFGFRDDPLEIAFILGIVYFLQYRIERQCMKSKVVDILYQLSYVYVSYCVGYMSFCLLIRFKVRLFYCTFVVGLLGPCLLKLNERMITSKEKKDCFAEEKKPYSNIFLLFTKKVSDRNVFRVGSTILVLSLYLLPTIRYITIANSYLISLIPFMLSFMVVIFYVILFYECIKQRLYRQILNLLILGLLTWQLYEMCVLRNKVLDQQQKRIAWNMSVVATYGMIYLQIGSTIRRQQQSQIKHQDNSETKSVQQSQYQCKSTIASNSNNKIVTFVHLNTDQHIVNTNQKIDINNQRTKIFLKVKSFIKQSKPYVVRLLQMLFYYSGLFLEFRYGSLINMRKIGKYFNVWYKEMMQLIFFSFLIGLYVGYSKHRDVKVQSQGRSWQQEIPSTQSQLKQRSPRDSNLKDQLPLNTSEDDGISPINNTESTSIKSSQQWQ